MDVDSEAAALLAAGDQTAAAARHEAEVIAGYYATLIRGKVPAATARALTLRKQGQLYGWSPPYGED